MANPQAPAMRLRDERGRRLYLTPTELRRVIRLAKAKPPEVHAFCHCLAYTGCRISEALMLRPSDVYPEEGVIVIHSLKKRTPGHVREIPVPKELIDLLMSIARDDDRFWPVGRVAAWRWVKVVMLDAGICGPQATAKGFRHGFVVNALLKGVPEIIVQRWAGHTNLSTTAIYAQVCGPEERMFAARMWG